MTDDYRLIKDVTKTASQGDWFLLWPGFYGPFTACWINRQWYFAAIGDLNHAVYARRINPPGVDLSRRGRFAAHQDNAEHGGNLCPTCGHDIETFNAEN